MHNPQPRKKKSKPPYRLFSVVIAVALYVAFRETRKPEIQDASLGTVQVTSSQAAGFAAPVGPTFRPASPSERQALDQILTSLDIMVQRARSDMANDLASDQHRALVNDVERDLQLDSLRLGASPSGQDRDPQYFEAYQQTYQVMFALRRVMTYRPTDPPEWREEPMRQAEAALKLAIAARQRMAR
jgi:hypothetical protein